MAQPGFFSWVKPAFQNKRTLKTWIRCCVALAASLVLMVSTKPSNIMGQAAFFAVIVSVLLPPSLALSVFILASTTLLIGMLLGWAWGNAGMAAALSVRSSSLLARQQQKIASSLDSNLPPALRVQGVTFHGIFLDPRSSTVYGVFLFIGTFTLAALQAHAPNLALLSIFSMIVLDVICTTGPLLPTANYLIAKSFILPTTFYLAVAIASLVLVFPESLSHVWITSLNTQFLTPTLELLRLQSEALASRPSDSEAWMERNAKGVELRTALTASVEAVTGQLKLIDLDVSVGRLGPTDLKKINAELKYIMFHARGLHAFHVFVADSNALDEKHAEEEALALAGQAPSARSVNRFQTLRAQLKAREEQHGHDLDSLVPILFAASAALRGSAEAALSGIIDWLQDANSQRLTGLIRRTEKTAVDKRQENLQQLLMELQTALAEFKTSERIKLIRPYEKFFDPVTRRPTSEEFASRSLYICFVLIDTLGTFADRVAKLLQVVTEIDAQRTKVRVWFPGRVVAVKENIMGNQFKTGTPLSLGTVSDPESFESTTVSPEASQTQFGDDKMDTKERLNENFARSPEKRNPDAFPPKTGSGKAFLKLAGFFRFFKSANGIYALRMGIVSVALWIPSVCESTAWFYYDNKGLWALIMAQTGLAIYAGDQIAGFVTRITGTILGLLIGMAAWYIGAGRGHGNPYGVVIASTIAIAPFLLGRIAGPPSQVPLWSILGITIVFVVGYSWINANHVVLSNPGVGITLGWKRALLVIIGFTAAFIIMLFPNPKSSRVLIRKTLAAIISEEGHIFAGEVEAFLAEDERAKRGETDDSKTPLSHNIGEDGKDLENKSVKEKRILHIAKRFISVSDRLTFIQPSLVTAKFEPQLAGTWPHEQYEQLFALQSRILGGLALLITAFAKLDTKWCRALIHRTPYMNPNFLSDVFMTVTILSHTLMAGTPLPASFPKLRDRLVYHGHIHSGNRFGISPQRNIQQTSGRSAPANDDSSSESIDNMKKTAQTDSAAGPSNVDGSSIGFEDDEITLDLLMDEQLPIYSTAIVALSNLISRLDDTIDIVRTLCGEASFQGYEALQRDYLAREETNYGKH